MSRNWKYVGPSDEVEVVYDGAILGTVKQGHQLKIDNPDASKALEGSPDWEHVPAGSTKSKED